jgi:hypothetical protein
LGVFASNHSRLVLSFGLYPWPPLSFSSGNII